MGVLPKALETLAEFTQRMGKEMPIDRIFNKYWLSFKVPISDLVVGPLEGDDHISIPHYKVGSGSRPTTMVA